MKVLLLSLRWLLIVVSAIVWGCSLWCLLNGHVPLGMFGLGVGYVCWPDTMLLVADKSVPCGEVYGIPYYRDWDGSRQVYRATVYGQKVYAPHEPAMTFIITKMLRRSIAHRAVDRVIGRLA